MVPRCYRTFIRKRNRCTSAHRRPSSDKCSSIYSDNSQYATPNKNKSSKVIDTYSVPNKATKSATVSGSASDMYSVPKKDRANKSVVVNADTYSVPDKASKSATMPNRPVYTTVSSQKVKAAPSMDTVMGADGVVYQVPSRKPADNVVYSEMDFAGFGEDEGEPSYGVPTILRKQSGLKVTHKVLTSANEMYDADSPKENIYDTNPVLRNSESSA